LRTEKAVKYDNGSMLEAIRRYQYSWQVKLPFAVLALVMTFWGFGAGMFNRIHPVATINGNQILSDQVNREATQLRQVLQQMYGANASSVMKNINIRQEALDRLIESPHAINGTLSLDDIRVLPLLRSAAIVKGLSLPRKVRDYFETMMSRIGYQPLPAI